MGTLRTPRHLDFKHAQIPVLPNLRFKGHFRFAVHLGGALGMWNSFHVAPCDFAIVSDADEQSTAFRVRKRGQGLGDFLGVVHAQFEVLMLVLPSSIMRRM